MRTFFLLLFIGSISFVNAQGLEFSRVVILKGELPTTAVTIIGTVPAGKVWKVEAVAMEYNIRWLANNGQIELNSTGDEAFIFADNTDEKLVNPVWLPEGETIELKRNSSTDGYFFSIIEFTVGN